MTKRSETKQWQPDIIKTIKRFGGYARKTPSEYQKGFPDIYAVQHGTTVLIEVKVLTFTKFSSMIAKNMRRKVPLTEIQRLEIERISRAGGNVEVLVIMQALDAGLDDTLMGFVTTQGLYNHLKDQVYVDRRNTGGFVSWGSVRRSIDFLGDMAGAKASAQ